MISNAKRNLWTAAALAALLGATPAFGARCLSTDGVFKTGPRFSDYAAGPEKIAYPAPVEDEARDCVRCLHWAGARLEQGKFVPAKDICRR